MLDISAYGALGRAVFQDLHAWATSVIDGTSRVDILAKAIYDQHRKVSQEIKMEYTELT